VGIAGAAAIHGRAPRCDERERRDQRCCRSVVQYRQCTVGDLALDTVTAGPEKPDIVQQMPASPTSTRAAGADCGAVRSPARWQTWMGAASP
jgi:uncharacterized protein (DUF849 family)